MIKKLLAGATAFLIGVLATVVGFAVYMVELMGRATDDD